MKKLSRISFATFVILSLTTPSWRYGPFSWWPIWRQEQFSGGPVQIGLLNLLPLLVLVSWALQKRGSALNWGSTAIRVPFALFSVWALARLWAAPERFLFVYGGGLLLAWFTYLFVVNDPGPLRTTLTVVIFIQAIVGILQFMGQGDLGLAPLGELPLNPEFSGVSVIRARDLPWLRAYGLTAHPNLYGALLALCMAIVLTAGDSMCDAEDTGTGRWLVILIGVIGLFFSFSRAAWLGTLFGLGTWFFVRWRHGSWPSRKSYVWLIILTLAVIVALVMYGDLASNRFTNLQDPLEARSIHQRISDARIALRLSLRDPMMGVGFGRYVDVAVGYSDDAQRVHNVFLLAFAELGVPGLVVVFWLFLGPAKALIDLYRRGSPLAAASGLAPWLVVITVNQLDTTLWLGGNWQTAILFALAAGQVSRTVSKSAGSKALSTDSEATARNVG